MRTAAAIACWLVALLWVAWFGVATFVVPSFMKAAEEQGRALSAAERLLFEAAVTTARSWCCCLVPLALLFAAGLAVLLVGRPIAADADDGPE